MLRILSSEKRFSDPVIGSWLLNHWGMHSARMRLAMAVRNWRGGYRRARLSADPAVRRLRQDGVVAIPDFLSPDTLEALTAEVMAATAKAARDVPPQTGKQSGFGKKITYDWGFDRYDGGTLNRFINPASDMPQVAAFAAHPRLSDLSAAVVGKAFPNHKIQIYETFHGDQAAAPDLQKDWHRDTFFPSLKFWFFLRDVTLADGPFLYAKGTHMLSAARLAFEKAQALAAAAGGSDSKSGSFRLSPEQAASYGFPTPEPLLVKAGTLVVADTFGFHARGEAEANAYRLAIYGWFRPHPYRL